MQDIDFLPAEHHQQHARRQVQPWRIVVVAAFAILLAAAGWTQYRQRRQAESDLAAVEAPYNEAVRLKNRLAELQGQIQTVGSDAELLAYLRHPWPRTQLLWAIVSPLPKQVTIDQFQFTQDIPLGQPAVEPRPASDVKAEEERLRKAPASQRDGKRLRDECDKGRLVVHIAGTTTDPASLYRYLGGLTQSGLFVKTEIGSLESLETPGRVTLRFQATLPVRPGYGQPGSSDVKAEGRWRRAGKEARKAGAGIVMPTMTLKILNRRTEDYPSEPVPSPPPALRLPPFAFRLAAEVRS